ncbi:MAG: CinA family protein [Silicimonas sp.]|jgi:nicotinamide-nucleotide amidase|nr:CinA family protein [Silicimonas sp.]
MSAAALIDLARDGGVKIATAESCTGGLIAAAITDIAGSSDVFDRGFVTYSNAAKTEMLDVPPDVIDTHGAVSEAVARAMAAGALRHSDAALAVSVTGVAGPGGTEAKPEGMVCFGLATRDMVHTETVLFGALGRRNVRERTVAYALEMLESHFRKPTNR